jgi:uncharacterized membrane protein
MTQGARLAVSRHRSLALVLAVATVFLAGCAQVGTSQLTFWDVVWSMIAFFFWFMFIWIFINIFADIFRRDDLSGAWKAIWLLALVFLPFLGALIYIVTRPKMTAQDLQMMTRAEAGMKAASGVSTADELAKLQSLKDSGAISQAEYDALKQKVIGTSQQVSQPSTSTPPANPPASS